MDNNHLHSLDISKNNLGDSDQAVMAISLIIEDCKSLYSLNLSQTGLDDKYSALFLESAAESTSLLDINLSNNKIGAVVVSDLAEYFKNNHSIVKINLSNNQNDEQFQSGLVGFIKASNSLLSVGDIAPYLEHHEALNSLLDCKAKTFKENIEVILKKPDFIKKAWPLSKLFTTFKQLQYKAVTTEGIWEKAKFVFEKISLLYTYETMPEDQEIAEIFTAELKGFRQDYDYLS
jgi:hypothetical protein